MISVPARLCLSPFRGGTVSKAFHFLSACIVAGSVTAVVVAADAQVGDLVRISAVVVDREGRPARNLQATDFTVREDGKNVAVTAFKMTNAAETAVSGRSIVLLLGGQGGDPELTKRYQQISQAFFDRATSADTISVVRMKDDHDEVAGSRQDQLMRLAEFRAPYGEPLNPKTQHSIMDRIARISKDLPDDPSRKAIVCIGPAFVFDVIEPPQREYELEWPHWVKALTASARANASVYAIDPKPLNGRIRINPDGLIVQTGGTVVESSNDFAAMVDQIWNETGSYYTFEYTPAGGKRELHSIEVKASRPDVRVRARRSR